MNLDWNTTLNLDWNTTCRIACLAMIHKVSFEEAVYILIKQYSGELKEREKDERRNN